MDEREPKDAIYRSYVPGVAREEFETYLGAFATRYADAGFHYVIEPFPEDLPFPAENKDMVTMMTVGESHTEVPVITRNDVNRFYRKYYADTYNNAPDKDNLKLPDGSKLPDPSSLITLTSVLFSPSIRNNPDWAKIEAYLVIDEETQEIYGLKCETVEDFTIKLNHREIIIQPLRDKRLKILDLYVNQLFEPPQAR